MQEVKIKLPYPPSVNSLYKRMRNHVYITPKGRAYYTFVQEIVHINNVKGFDGDPKLVMHVDVIPPDNRKRDIDNILKVTLDSLKKAKIYEDDSQIKRLNVQMLDKDEKKQAYIEVFLAII